MQFLNRLLNGLADGVLRPWAGSSPWPALGVASLLTAAVLVGLFSLTSNQPAIRRARNRYIARTLELLVFRHDLRISLSACWRILLANVAYLGQFLRPFLISAVPLLLIYVQMAEWFEHRPLRVGETATVEVALQPEYPVLKTPVTLTAGELAVLDSPGVRSAAGNSVTWRVRATSAGAGSITVQAGEQTATKRLMVADGLARVSTHRVPAGVSAELLSPGEAPLPTAGPIAQIHVSYPARELWLGSSRIHWTIAAVVLMMGLGLVLGRLFGVRLA